MKFMSMTSLPAQVIKLIVTFFCLMTLVSCGGGGGWGGTPSGTPAALFTTAPSTLALRVGAAEEYTITGGRAPYTVNSSSPSIAAAFMVSSDSFRITPVLAGSANVVITDIVGTPVITVAVTVTNAALFSTAPSALTLVVGTAQTYTVSGGLAPYTVNSSNEAISVASIAANKLSILAVSVGAATIGILDASGKSIAVSVTVSDGSSATPLYTTAPSALTLVVGTAQTYTVSGGLVPYTVNSSNPVISVASITANKLNIAAVSVGAASIGILDAAGKSISVSVTVSNGSSATPLFTTAPASITISNGGTRTYSIGGGLAPYTATSSDTIIATTGVIGSTLSIEGVAGGSTSVLVRDAANTMVTISVKVGFANTFFTTAPSALTILVGAAPTYTISGGSGIYAASSSNINIVQATVVGSSLTIAGVAAGTATVSVLDSTGAAVTIAVNVSTSATALYTTAPSSITIAPGAAPTYGLGGGIAPYIATTSNAGVATASVSGPNLTIVGVVDGSATIQVMDSTRTAVTVNVTVSAGAVTALYTTAPSAVTLAKGAAASYTIGGGRAPYTATTSAAGVATASASGTSLTIVGVVDGSAQVRVVDSIGGSVTISVTIGSGTSTALFTSAPSPVTISIAATSTYVIGGGIAPYTANSGNASVATASASGTSLTITGVAAGSTSVAIRDSVGGVVTVNVTVSAGAVTLPTVLPSAASANVGDVLNFSISGGSAPYGLTVNNTSIATVSTSSVAASGGTFTATLRNAGSTIVTIVDAVGQTTTLNLTVNATSAALRLSPSAMQIGENNSAAIVLNIYGGTAPYRAFTNDLVLSSVTTAGTTFTVAVGSAGNRCITPASPFGTYDVILTVVDSLGASAISTMTIKDNGGAACP